MSNNFFQTKFPSLSAVVHQMVKRAPSGICAKTIYEIVGYSNYNTMMSELSSQPGHKLGADMLLPLMDVTESDAPVEFLARERGGVFIKLFPVEGHNEELMKTLAVSIKEFSDFVTEASKSIADNCLTKKELDRIVVEGHEAIEAIMKMMKLSRITYDNQNKLNKE